MLQKFYIISVIFLGLLDIHAENYPNVDYIQMSQDFVYEVKTDGNATPYLDSFAIADENILEEQLKTDDEKKAFFINLYNAYTQYILKKDPDKYINRKDFFKAEQISFASHKISLDKIEHGFLRKSRVKWSLGYFRKLFPSQLERKFRVKKIDYRIHFTLNCGASSCPAIAFYNSENLNKQLDLATKVYLKSEAEYIKEKNILFLPVLMSWFRGDFGGKKNILNLCKSLQIIPPTAKPTIKYKPYNWELYLNNYKAE
jgi:hypothetical protein